MTIDWTHFRPGSQPSDWSRGRMAHLLAGPRILGAARLLGRLARRPGDGAWRIALLAGLVAAPLVAQPRLRAAAPMIEAALSVLSMILGVGLFRLLEALPTPARLAEAPLHG